MVEFVGTLNAVRLEALCFSPLCSVVGMQFILGSIPNGADPMVEWSIVLFSLHTKRHAKFVSQLLAWNKR